MKIKSALLTYLIIASSSFLCISQSHAVTLYWDGTSTTVDGLSSSATGTTWSASAGNWDDGTAEVLWTAANSSVFGGTASTVNIDTGGISIGGGDQFMRFDRTGYVLSAGTNGLNFGTSGTDAITLIANNSAALAATTISGTVGGSGNLILSAQNGITSLTNSFTFNGASTTGWSGSTAVNAGATLALSATSQALVNTSGITLNGGNITLTNIAAQSALDRVKDTAAITSNGGMLQYTNTSGAGNTYAESIGSVDLAGGQTIIVLVNNQAAGSQTLTLGGLTRSGSTSTAALCSGSATAGVCGLNTTSNMLKVTGISSATPSGEIYAPWATAGSGNVNQSKWVTFDSGGYALPDTIADTADDSTWTNTSNAYSFNIGGAAGTVTINTTRTIAALRYTGTVTTTLELGSGNLETYGLFLTGSNTKNVTSTGGKLTTPSGGGKLYIIPGTTGGAQPISAPISDNSGAVTVVAAGVAGSAFTLSNTTNSYSGGTVVTSGGIVFSGAGSWVANSNLTFGGVGTVTNSSGQMVGDSLEVKAGAVGTLAGGNGYLFTTTKGAGTINYSGSQNITLALGDASNFTGNVSLGYAYNNASTVATNNITFKSLNDAVGSSIRVFRNQGGTDSGQYSQIALMGDVAALTFDNRQIQILPKTGSNPTLADHAFYSNNATAANKWVINTNLLNLSDRSTAFTLSGSNTGDNAFNGSIGDSTATAGISLLVQKSGAGRWILGGSNTFTRGLVINNGTLSVGTLNEQTVAGPLGMSSVLQLGGSSVRIQGTAQGVIRTANNASGTLEYTGGAVTSSRSFFIGDSTAGGTGGGTIKNNSTTGAITFSAATFNQTSTGVTATRTLTLGGTYTGGANEIQGVIQDNDTGGLVKLVKADASTWSLSGPNTYTGTTTVNAGTLLINGSTSSGSAVTVTAGILGGSGTAAGSVTIGNGAGSADAILAPGNSIDSIDTGNLTFASDGSYSVEVDGSLATSDQTNVTGTVTIDSSTTLAVSVAGTLVAGQRYFIVVNDDVDPIAGTFAGLAQDGLVGTYGGVDIRISYTGDSGTLALTGGNDIVLYGEVGSATPYDTWALANGLDGTTGKESGKADDPDNDGRNNLAEFAFNGDPLDPTDNGMVAGFVQDASAPTGNELTLILAVRNGATFSSSGSPAVQEATVDGVTCTIEGSIDLTTIPGSAVSHVSGPSNTAPAGSELNANLTGADWKYHTFKLDASEGLPDKGFLRAKASE